nr:immunoglobulin light chain junction region [Macaca mulatta]
CLQHDSFPFTF